MDKAIDQLGQIESNYIDRLRRIAPLLSDKEILESVAANRPNAANMGKTMKSEAASKLGIFNKPEVQAPSAQDLSQFMVPEAPTAQDFAQFMKPMEPEPQPEATYQDFSQFMKPRPRAKFNQPSTQPQAPKAQAPKAQDSAQSIELKSKLLLDLVEKSIKKKMRYGKDITDDVVDKVRDLLNSGANPNIKNKRGEPLLFISMDPGTLKHSGNPLEITKLLLKAGANPNIYYELENKNKPRKYNTFASIFGSLNVTDGHVLKLLLDYGLDPNLPSYWRGKPNYPIYQKLSEEYFEEFTEGDNIGYNNLDEFKEKKLESLRLLLQSGADPTKINDDGRNALEFARYEYDTYGPKSGHFLEEVELIEEYMERMNRKMSGKVSVKEGRVFTQAGLGRRRSRKKKKSKNKKLKKGGKRSNKKSGKTLKKKRK
tara:strand:+ start:3024 stop:4304 length:1281 start_codon:yes stop_codon:yes gene_type:complete